MKKLVLAALAIAASSAFAQPQRMPIQDGQILPLWPNGAPGAQGTDDKDIPTITVYLPRSTPAGMTAVVVAPGGGYVNLAMNHEGRQVANYMNSQGVIAFVLKYRLGPKYHHPIELGDAQRAIRMVRANAPAWHINPERIGMMGFSAGGHLTMSASTHFEEGKADATDPIDRVSSRPDFSILGYPVISLIAPWTHQGSKNALLGPNADPALAKSLSGEESVTKDTPPTFIFQTNADTTVPAENATYYYLALRKNQVPAEMHIFERGPHGVGLAMEDPALSEWSKLLTNWMRLHQLIK
ncbi:MAG TPA: alpha/beta hydrolase [Bryobacteraceae bacterium]|nr:alpha/beta hydrolase [Bryobacteraceae bacterium]